LKTADKTIKIGGETGAKEGPYKEKNLVQGGRFLKEPKTAEKKGIKGGGEHVEKL